MEDRIYNTIAEQLKETVKRIPDKIAFVFPEEQLRLTFSQADKQSDVVAKSLLALGLKHGNHIGIWSKNHSRWVLLALGAAKIGVTIVPMNVCYRYHELSYIVKQNDVKVLFVAKNPKEKNPEQESEQFLSGHRINKKSFPKLEKIISLCDESNMHESWGTFIQHSISVSNDTFKEAQSLVSNQDIHLIQCTSGTTSRPKGAMLYQYGVLNTAYDYGKIFHLDKEDIACIPLPLFHCFGNVLTFLSCIIFGYTAIYMEIFSPQNALKIIQDEKCTFFAGVPTMYMAMMSCPDFSRYDLSTLTKAAIGGSFCNPHVMEEITKKFQLPGLSSGYGLSEAASLCTLSDIYDSAKHRLHTSGKIFPGMEIKITDWHTGEKCLNGCEGEILIRGYGIMKGYYNDPEETKKALDPEGWLHTGDLGILDHENYLHIVGRIKDIIIRGGENISPSEIEEKVLSLDQIMDCQCVGVPDDIYGEEIALFLITKNGLPMDREIITSYIKDHMAKYKVPKYIFYVTEFPINGSGKVMKSDLKKLAIEKLNTESPIL